MSETQNNPDPSEQARPGDASFLIGREGLALPRSLLEAPDLSAPVQPVIGFFEAMQRVWEMNGYRTGRIPREDLIDLPATGNRAALTLSSRYRGWSDEELPEADLNLHGRNGLRPSPGYDSMSQGVEEFAISLTEVPPIDKDGAPARGRPSLVASKTHRYKLVEPEGTTSDRRHSRLKAVADSETEEPAPPRPAVEPDPESDSVYVFLGNRRIYPDFSITGKQTLRVFQGLLLPEELQNQAGGHPFIESYQMWISHFAVSELLTDTDD